jgi:cobalt/nickel transport system permease protein
MWASFDALVSAEVGGVLWAVTAGAGALAARHVERDGDDRSVPLMGVLGAFVFAGQMVNFAIPGTGSSGHLGGGLLLSILLGPDAAFLVMACVLGVQALFFADGGLLALGCNAVNLGLLTSYVAYPLVWKPIAGPEPTRARLVVASVLASVVGLQLGAFGVVLETVASGVSTLPFRSFALLMQPIHLAIGIVEGVVTGGVLLVLREVRPELVSGAYPRGSLRPLLLGMAAAAILAGGVLSSLASARPDGLEWAAGRASGGAGAEPEGPVHRLAARLQRATALMPDYGLPVPSGGPAASAEGPRVSPGTSVAGLVGTLVSLAAAFGIGAVLRAARRRPR